MNQRCMIFLSIGILSNIKFLIMSQIISMVVLVLADLLITPIFHKYHLTSWLPSRIDSKQQCYWVQLLFCLVYNGFQCSVQNKTVLLQWNSTVWVNATFNGNHSTGIIYNRFCKSGNKSISIGKNPSKQCASNRTGILCGACMDNFSLAIGSSQCIECPNCHNMALLFAFVAAGVFLVLFILALNLTVTQGFINGMIFYANIIWAYKIILFPSYNNIIGKNYLLMFLQGFVAWLNLDLGIETYFFVGLNAFLKTWLQFLFPFYIWGIAGVIIFACRYSFRLTNLIGSRAVPLLAPLFLLWRVSHLRLLKWIDKFAPVYDAYFSPLKDKHRYWFGTTLLVRGILIDSKFWISGQSRT